MRRLAGRAIPALAYVLAAVSIAFAITAAGAGASATPSCPSLPGQPSREVSTSITAYCLTCHAGKIPGGFSHAAGAPAPGSGPAEATRSHPVDRKYPEDRAGDFRPRASLDGRLTLTSDGKISCLTCHGGREAASRHLSIPDTGSALCIACHIR